MISKQQQKYIQSLHNKKYRVEYRQFIVEGEKSLAELLNSGFNINELFCTEIFAEKYRPKIKFQVCTENQIQACSYYKTNSSGIAIVDQKPNLPPLKEESFTLLLDNINDPGNFGTIIRLADWYGLNSIICNQNTVEFYNPKVIAATMGSFTRISVYYTSLQKYLQNFKFPVYGADLEGLNLYKTKFEDKIGMVIGSESHGISPEVEQLLTQKITIPRLGNAESLNAGIATAIMLDNFFRTKF